MNALGRASERGARSWLICSNTVNAYPAGTPAIRAPTHSEALLDQCHSAARFQETQHDRQATCSTRVIQGATIIEKRELPAINLNWREAVIDFTRWWIAGFLHDACAERDVLQ